uniref:Methanol dehydrogenase regulator-like protein n=1 Tax=uncultured microorganism TaxID=358574 RepID=I3PGB2_9ZZZZ|nr:methanol dehydrogenase regulator-like protein [uncultured microorganism]
MDHITGFAEKYEKIRSEIAKEMIGQENVVEHLLLAVIAGGNVLLEGVPGLGKTHLVRVLSKVLDLPFSRIQFTPDLMPADITGTNILVRTEEGSSFRFQQGPLFASIVLADEINRATPKTQAALLEAMQEHSVTVAGETMRLPEPYFVLATQNPVEQEGTYPLPEAQLDRFLFKVLVPFPTLQELGGIMDLTLGTAGSGSGKTAEKAATGQELLALRETAKQVPVADSVRESALRLVLATHPETPDAPETAKKYLRFGASPRAAQAILSTARVRALEQGRYNVSFEDIRFVAPACLRHRLALNFAAVTEGREMESIVAELVNDYVK